MKDISNLFGSMVFNDTIMQDRLPRNTYKALKKTMTQGSPLKLPLLPRLPARPSPLSLADVHGREDTKSISCALYRTEWVVLLWVLICATAAGDPSDLPRQE